MTSLAMLRLASHHVCGFWSWHVLKLNASCQNIVYHSHHITHSSQEYQVNCVNGTRGGFVSPLQSYTESSSDADINRTSTTRPEVSVSSRKFLKLVGHHWQASSLQTQTLISLLFPQLVHGKCLTVHKFRLSLPECLLALVNSLSAISDAGLSFHKQGFFNRRIAMFMCIAMQHILR